MPQLINAPMTRKEFLTLPMDLRRKILERQAEKTISPKPGALCKKCLAFDNCDMRDASEYCGGFKRKKLEGVK